MSNRHVIAAVTLAALTGFLILWFDLPSAAVTLWRAFRDRCHAGRADGFMPELEWVSDSPKTTLAALDVSAPAAPATPAPDLPPPAGADTPIEIHHERPRMLTNGGWNPDTIRTGYYTVTIPAGERMAAIEEVLAPHVIRGLTHATPHDSSIDFTRYVEAQLGAETVTGSDLWSRFDAILHQAHQTLAAIGATP